MNPHAVQKLAIIQENALQDDQYQQLLTEYHMINRQFTHMVESFSPEQKDLVLDYIGIIAEMNRRLLELACLHVEPNNHAESI